MFTLAGFYETLANSAYVKIAALADPHLRISGDDIAIPSGLNMLLGAFARSPSMVKARLVSPSLRRFNNLIISPTFQQWQAQFNPNEHWMNLSQNMVALDVSEDINLEVDNNNASNFIYGGIWLADQIDPVPGGPRRTVLATGTTTTTAMAWSNVALTFDEDLPAGRYAVIGAMFQSANIVMARLVFPGAQWWRPGCLGIGEVVYTQHSDFRFGRMGLWGEFEHNLPPTVDFLTHSSDTAQVVHLDLVQIRAGASV